MRASTDPAQSPNFVNLTRPCQHLPSGQYRESRLSGRFDFRPTSSYPLGTAIRSIRLDVANLRAEVLRNGGVLDFLLRPFLT